MKTLDEIEDEHEAEIAELELTIKDLERDKSILLAFAAGQRSYILWSSVWISAIIGVALCIALHEVFSEKTIHEL